MKTPIQWKSHLLWMLSIFVSGGILDFIFDKIANPKNISSFVNGLSASHQASHNVLFIDTILILRSL